MKAGDILNEKYKLVRQLSASAMGYVWEAEELPEGQRVAVKALNEHLVADGALINRLLSEARTALKAPPSDHIIKVLDVVSGRGRPFYVVMEYVDGDDLGKIIERERKLKPRRAVELAVQACAALDEVHGRGLVHGRLRPESLFVTKTDKGAERLKLLDIGVPTFKPILPEHGLLTTGGSSVVKTPDYLAPEQLRATGVPDLRVDVYAAAVLLYQMLTGKLPFESDDAQEVMHRISKGSPLPLRHHRSAIGLGLEEVVMRAMSVDREQRFSTMTELADALRPHCEPEELLIPPPPSPQILGLGPPMGRDVTEDLEVGDLEFVEEVGSRNVTADLEVDELEFIDASEIEDLAIGDIPALPIPDDMSGPISEQVVSPLDSSLPLDFTFAGRRRIAIYVTSAIGGLSVVVLLSTLLLCSMETEESRPVGAGTPREPIVAKALQDAAQEPPEPAVVEAGAAVDDAAIALADDSGTPTDSGSDADESGVSEDATMLAQAEDSSTTDQSAEPELASASGPGPRRPHKGPASTHQAATSGGQPTSAPPPASDDGDQSPPAENQETRRELLKVLRSLAPAVKRCYRFRSSSSVLIRYRVSGNGSISYQAASPRPARLTARCLGRAAQGARAPSPPGSSMTLNVRYRLE